MVGIAEAQVASVFLSKAAWLSGGYPPYYREYGRCRKGCRSLVYGGGGTVGTFLKTPDASICHPTFGPMRLLTAATLAALLFPAATTAIEAQTCASLSLRTQAGVDAVACDAVMGDVYISGNDIENLYSLSGLVSVGGFVDVFNNPNLASLSGLEDLTSVGGNLRVNLSPTLTSLDGLDRLTSVGGSVQITNNEGLTSLSGLSALTAIGGLVNISNNSNLTSLGGLDGLNSVEGYFQVVRNPRLQSLNGLDGLAFVDGFLAVIDNAALRDVDALAGLSQVNGLFNRGLYFEDNPLLERCAVGLGPLLFANESDPDVIGAGIDEANVLQGNGTALPGGTAASDCNSTASILAAYVPPPPSTLPITEASLSAPGGELVLPAGRARAAVTANATFTGDAGQRFTVFVRLDGPDGFSRLAFRGEIKPEAGETVSQTIRFRTFASDPAGAYTVTLLVAEGSVEAPETAEPIATLPATKLGGAGLRVAEALSAYPNPAAGQATLRFGVAEAGEATLVVYDALGREVARPVDGAVDGVVEARLDAAGLAPGVYVARLVTAAGTETVRLTVAR